MTPGTVLIAFAWAACAAAGAVPGSRKGHPLWGFVMGLLLSVIGVVIVALSRDDRKPRHAGQQGGGVLAAYRETRKEPGDESRP